MPIVSCTEPGLGGESNAVKLVRDFETLFFPHVDSCMAVVFFLSDGRAIGGHVPMQWGADDGLDPAGNFGRILRAMKLRVPSNVTVVRAISIGDEESAEAMGIPYNVARLGRGNHVHASGPRGVDIKVDMMRGGKVTITPC